MQYKITKQYARGEEKPLAEFHELIDAQIFMSKKTSNHDEEKPKLIYRLYNDSELSYEINEESISTGYAKYAEGNSDLNIVPFTLTVLIKTKDSSERNAIASFNDKDDANLFIFSKCEADNTINDSDLFSILKGTNLIDTSNRTISNARKKASDRSNDGDKGSKLKICPPQPRPKPQGSPVDFWVEDNDDA